MLRLAIKYHLLITFFFLFSCNTTQNSIDIYSENNDVSSSLPFLTATMDNPVSYTHLTLPTKA